MAAENSKTAISKSLPTNLDQLSSLLGNPTDLKIQTYGPDHSLGVVFLESLVDRIDLKTSLLKPILPLLDEKINSLEKMAALLPETGLHLCAEMEEVTSDLFQGHAVLFLEKETSALSFEFPGWAKHQLKEPISEETIRGPREGFTETLSDNIGLIRRWIKDNNLRADPLEIGRRTKTKIAIMYLSDVAHPRLVKEVHRRLSAIDIDGIIDSGYIEQLIKDRRATIFQLTQATERTDKVSAAILEGRIAILVDKSPMVILVPVTANELYQSPDDYYENFWIASLNRFFRMLASILAVGLPGLYVAFVSVNPELLPTQLALIIASQRVNSPFSLATNVFLLDFVVGIFYEAGARMPAKLSPIIGITFGVLIGIATVFSGVTAPITVIIVAIAALAAYASPSYYVGNVWRILKYIMILAATLYGLFGLSIVGIIILGHMSDLKSFGVSFMAPWAPLQWPELADTVVRIPFWARWMRAKTYRPQNKLRSGGTKREDDEDD